jgi:hypothetical protein
MKTKLFLSIALMLAFICNSQSVITVDNSVGSNAQFSDLQSAITLANPGDIIYIHPSEINYGNINVDKTLHLRGFGHSDPDKATLITDLILGENASNSSFSGLYMTDDFIVSGLSTTLTGLVFENNIVAEMLLRNAGVDDMLIRGNIIWKIGTSSGSTSFNNYTNTIISNNVITSKIYLKNYQSVEVKNNIFLTSNGVPIANFGSDNGSVTVQNNIIYYSATFTIDSNGAGVIFENCLNYNLGSGNVVALAGTNNIANIDPLFVSAANSSFDSDIDDYHLQGGSLAIGNGVAGEDMGIFNAGPFVFNNFGYTNGIPTVKITAITNSVTVGGNLEVTINTNSN